MVEIWSFKTHYMVKYSIGNKSYGWRVDTPIHEDKELYNRINRLINKVKEMI